MSLFIYMLVGLALGHLIGRCAVIVQTRFEQHRAYERWLYGQRAMRNRTILRLRKVALEREAAALARRANGGAA